MNTYKLIISYLFHIGLFIMVMLSLTTFSCEKYLDAAPEVEVETNDVFGDFIRYQGFVEELYQSLPDLARAQYEASNWNWSNDVIARQFQTMGARFEKGAYRGWTSSQYSPFRGFPNEPNNNNVALRDRRRRGIWHDGWYGIRVANMAIENIDKMSGTEEERNLILGQAYFFRGYFHFAIMAAWGGIPYIDVVLAPTDKLEYPRLSYLESAKRVADDMEMAVTLLPKSWDETAAGKRTIGVNKGRITKGIAYAYLGKNWLYAASPLMNGTETGNYTYNAELARLAADVFSEVINIANEGYYGLESWEDYHTLFWRMDGTVPHGKEWIFGNPVYSDSRRQYGEHLMSFYGGQGKSNNHPPTLELVNKFGMANGLPITEPDSKYDPTDPWSNRDPRFDYSIITDGDRMLYFTTAHPLDEFASFYVGGRHRTQAITGFHQRKFWGKGANNKDQRWGSNYYMQVPYMRLAHVYLMYAEAVNEGYDGPLEGSPGSISAVEAVNIVRNRATLPDLDARFTTSREVFRYAVRNEIGVELALEGHQWYDYRRWYIAHLEENRTKTALEFDQNHTYFKTVLERTIQFDIGKHYWLPFDEDDVALYAGFYQNPGW